MMPAQTIRHTLYRDPIAAILQAAESGCEVDRDYVIAHLKIPPGEWEVRVALARTALWIQLIDPEDWGGIHAVKNSLSPLPHEVQVQFACDCAVRAMVGQERAGRIVDPRSWGAITAARRWLRGTITHKTLRIAAAYAYTAADAAYAAADAAHADYADAAYAAAHAAYAAYAAHAAAAADAAAYAAYAAAAAADAAADAADRLNRERRWQINRLSLLCNRAAIGRIQLCPN